jgi:hypothetical protein
MRPSLFAFPLLCLPLAGVVTAATTEPTTKTMTPPSVVVADEELAVDEPLAPRDSWRVRPIDLLVVDRNQELWVDPAYTEAVNAYAPIVPRLYARDKYGVDPRR